MAAAAILMRSGRTLRLTVAASWGAVARTANIILAFTLAYTFTRVVAKAEPYIDAAQVAASGVRCPSRPHL